LILDVCGGEPAAMDDQLVNLPERKPVNLRVARAAKVIGMPVTQSQCGEVLRRLGLPLTETPGVITVTPPSWRFDLQIEEDLIEEVVRVLGYHVLPASAPHAPVTRACAPSRNAACMPCATIAGLDYQETINFSFVEERWERELAVTTTDPRL